MINFFTILLLIFIVDIPFIYFIGNQYNKLWFEPISFNARVILASLAIYTALALSILYVVIPSSNPLLTAFIVGMTAYTTYAFTVYALYSKWPLWLTVGESIWGGLLLFITTYIITTIK